MQDSVAVKLDPKYVAEVTAIDGSISTTLVALETSAR